MSVASSSLSLCAGRYPLRYPPRRKIPGRYSAKRRTFEEFRHWVLRNGHQTIRNAAETWNCSRTTTGSQIMSISAAGLSALRNNNIPRGVLTAHPITIARAEGALVWDVEGKQYLDFVAGIGVLNVGHNHPRVVAAVEKQLKESLTWPLCGRASRDHGRSSARRPRRHLRRQRHRMRRGARSSGSLRA